MSGSDGAAHRRFATAAMVVLALFAAWRIGVFSPWTTVAGPDGPTVIPNALAAVDHPFHVARAELLRRSWADGEPLRWVGSHQQGYPAEFYPFGAQALTVAFWAAAFGALPIGWAHGAMVALVFALPGVGYWLAARRDRLPPAVALLAFSAQIVIPGAWWHGGYTELVQWGLVTNVAGAAWQFLALVWLTGWVNDGRRRDGALAIAAGSAALLTNPRSAFALASIFGGVALAALVPRSSASRMPAMLGRLLIAGAGMCLIAAPELLSLARFSRYYEFLHYSGYGSVTDWLASSAVAAWWPVAILSIVGLIAALGAPDSLRADAGADARPPLPTSRAVAFTLLLYGMLTAAAIQFPDAVSQLEATRLMPFQRSLMLWFGALGAWATVRALLRFAPRAGAWGPAAMFGLAAALILFWMRPGGDPMPLPGPPDAPTRGLYAVARTGDPTQADLEAAVRAADAAAPPGTAILVLGSNVSWHQQLWAPLWSDRPFLYDNWLWFWRANHDGPPGYTFQGGHSYPRPQLALDKEYLRANGIGAVVAASGFTSAAERRPWLAPASEADRTYVAWAVRDPVPLAVSGDGTAAREVAYRNGSIEAVTVADGPVTIAQAWFPRWQATTGGSPLPLSATAVGTIQTEPLLAGSGIDLRYGTDLIDWAGRLLAACGVMLAAGLAITGLAGGGRARRDGGVSS